MAKEAKRVKVLIEFTENNEGMEPTEYEFGSEAEKTAFLLGLDEGVAWGEYHILDAKEVSGPVRIIPGL